MGKRVVLAMSGGVDSSVAAHLLQAQGHEVIGLFMRTGAHGEEAGRRAKTCCSAVDALDARAVADRLDIPFYALDFEGDFARIMDQFADEYAAGRTPNPCVSCNIWLKFGKLWSYGKQVGADFVATGHYARIVQEPDGTPRVARAVERGKDQSYVLSGLRRELLPHVLLPIGEYGKADVRALAKGLNLPVHDKADSQEICFIPDDNYARFVRERRPGLDTAGPIVDGDGKTLGQHAGIEGFTIGQRKGLGVAVGEPRYVVQIEPTSNTVTIGPRAALDREGLEASRFNWQVAPPDGPLRCLAQIRAQHKAVGATVEPIGDGRVNVRFDAPQQGVSPGQVVTLYDGELVLGGGWIDRALGVVAEPAQDFDRNREPGVFDVVTVGMYYDVIPEKAPMFTAKFREVISLLGTVAGHKSSYLYQMVDDPFSFAILSEWDDQQAFLDFIRSDTFKGVTTWGREQVLRNAPRHKIYPRAEDLGRPAPAP